MRHVYAITGLGFAAIAALMIYTGSSIAGVIMALAASGMAQASMMAARTAELRRVSRQIGDRQ